MMEEDGHGMLRATGRAVDKLTWAATAREMAATHEDWSAWDTAASDGLDHVAAWETEERAGMPEIARFFGIIIRMFAEPAAPHHRPHFHAYYQDEVAIFTIDVVEIIEGNLPQRQRRLVEAWAEIHQAELLAAWERLQGGRPPGKIEPLR